VLHITETNKTNFRIVKIIARRDKENKNVIYLNKNGAYYHAVPNNV
jgi:hypothetical protein